MVLKKMLLSVVVVGMISSAAFAIAPMGPPMAGLPQGQYAIGGGYAFSDMNLEVSGPFAPVTPGPAVLNDVQSNIYYGCLAYGISNTWNVYGALGAADAEFPGDGLAPDFQGNHKFAYAVGCKKTLFTNEENGTVWGTVFQYSRARSEDRVTTTASGQTWGNGSINLPSGRPEAELQWYELQLAAGPTIPVCDGVSLYGGGLLHFLEGDLEIKYPSSSGRYEYEIEQKLELGGYIGTQVELGSPDATLSAEFLWTGEAWGFGLNVMVLCP